MAEKEKKTEAKEEQVQEVKKVKLYNRMDYEVMLPLTNGETAVVPSKATVELDSKLVPAQLPVGIKQF